MKKKINLLKNSKAINDGLLEGTIVLQLSILRGLVKNKSLVKMAEDKVAAVLVSAGLTQERVAKLLTIKKGRVVSACKDIKL